MQVGNGRRSADLHTSHWVNGITTSYHSQGCCNHPITYDVTFRHLDIFQRHRGPLYSAPYQLSPPPPPLPVTGPGLSLDLPGSCHVSVVTSAQANRFR